MPENTTLIKARLFLNDNKYSNGQKDAYDFKYVLQKKKHNIINNINCVYINYNK